MLEFFFILLVEDEPDLIKITQFWLENAGYKVIVAEDGARALALIKNSKPDLIFLDLQLPVISGHDVCKTLKADPETKEIPIILLTASVDGIERKAQELKADGYLLKPFEEEMLLGKAKQYSK